MKLACILPSCPNGSQLYRFQYPSEWLSKSGVEIVKIKAYTDTSNINEEQLYECDLAIFYRFIPDNWEKVAENLKKRHIPFLLDLDDWEPDIPHDWLYEAFHVLPPQT